MDADDLMDRIRDSVLSLLDYFNATDTTVSLDTIVDRIMETIEYEVYG